LRISRLRFESGHQPSPFESGPHAIGSRTGGSGSVFFRLRSQGCRFIVAHSVCDRDYARGPLRGLMRPRRGSKLTGATLSSTIRALFAAVHNGVLK
jgi:hypothetical protein